MNKSRYSYNIRKILRTQDGLLLFDWAEYPPMFFPNEEDVEYILKGLHLERMPYDVKWELTSPTHILFNAYEDRHWHFCDYVRELMTGEDHYFKLGGIIKKGLDKG